MKCPSCGAEIVPGSAFCAGCGTQLIASPANPPRKGASPALIVGIVGCGCMLLIVPILAAILFPVFAKARESARKTSCQQNLKEIGTAIAMYCGDYNDTLPSSAIGGHSAVWDKSAFSSFAAPMEGDSTSWKELLLPYKKDGTGFSCPSDGDLQQERASYNWKAAVDYAWFNRFKKLGSFGYPADQVVMYEHNGWHWGDSLRGLTDGVTINCLYIDGHVAAKRIMNSGYTDGENSPLPASGKGEPAWFNGDLTGATSVSKFWRPDKYLDNLP